MSQSPANATLAERLRSVQVGVRPELEVSRHLFHGEPTYVVRDPITFQSHQLSCEDYQVFVSINSEEPLSATFSRLQEQGIVAAAQEEDFYRFVLNLSQMGVLSLPITNSASLYTRFKRKRLKTTLGKAMGMLFFRVPLIQPDAFLDRTIRWINPVFSVPGFVAWMIAVVACLSVVVAHWSEFTSPLGTILAIQNLPVLWALLIGLKAFHEFGHAYACKFFGGRVPEMGAYFVIFTPCAYVDASASWGFPRPLHRIIVALGGMYFESMAAIVAVAVWTLTSPGPIHSAAHYAIVLSTVITLGFNINPLMKYDGYYVLSDLLGMPNLRAESQRQIQYLASRYLFANPLAEPTHSPIRAAILTVFGILCSAYKTLIVLGIAIAIAFKIPAFGLAIAVAYLVNTVRQIGLSFARQIAALDSSRARLRAAGMTAMISVAGLLLLFAFPAPGSTGALGVLKRQYDHVVHAATDGFLTDTITGEGDTVDVSDVICRLENHNLRTLLVTKEAEMAELRIQIQSELDQQPAEAAAGVEELERLKHETSEIAQRVDRLTVRSPASGNLTQGATLKQVGRFIQQGEPLATVSQGEWVVTSLASAETVSMARPKVGKPVSLRFPAAPGRAYRGSILRVAPAGSAQIENAALTQVGGGTIAVSPDSMEATEPYFEVVIGIESPGENLKHGMTAWIVFQAEQCSVGEHLFRRVLRLLNRLRLAS